MLGELASPFAYLRIRHDEKRKVDFLFPSIACALTFALFFLFATPELVWKKDGFLDRLLLVCSVLPGFYIAALAAIATYNRPDIDEVMPKPTPSLKVRVGSQQSDVPLTRRRFLAHLMSFLCAESFLVMLLCAFGLTLGPGIARFLPHLAWWKWAYFIVVTFAFWQMIFATFLGLFYLGDRLHRPTT